MRTLGSLTQSDLGMVVTIEHADKATTTRGILAEVRHRSGDTSGRPVTTIRLINRDGDKFVSIHNHMENSDRGGRSTFPDSSGYLITVAPEVGDE